MVLILSFSIKPEERSYEEERERHFCFLFRISYISKTYQRALFIIWFGNNFAFQHSLRMSRGMEACRKRRWNILFLLFIDFVQLSMEASCNKSSSLRKMTKSSRTTWVHNCWNKKLHKVIARERNMHTNAHRCVFLWKVWATAGDLRFTPMMWEAATQPVGALPRPPQGQKSSIPIPTCSQTGGSK